MSRLVTAWYDTIKRTNALRPAYEEKRIPAPAPADSGIDHDPGNLCWGAVGNLPTPELSPGINFEILDCNEQNLEAERESEVQRIENPDEPENWVEVDRPTKIFYNKREKKFGPKDNSSAAEPDFGGFAPTPIIFSSFKPLGTDTENKCRLTVTLKNGPNAV